MNTRIRWTSVETTITCRLRTTKTDTVVKEIKYLCGVMVGLRAGCALKNRKATEELLIGRSHKDNKEFFQEVLEIGRRYKIMNPDKMRSTYGKLLFALMDSGSPYVSREIGFPIYKKVRTVLDIVEDAGAQELLRDPLTLVATKEVLDSDDRSKVELVAKEKEMRGRRCVKNTATSRLLVPT